MTPRFPGIKRIVHFAFGRRGLEREIDEELAFHFEEAMVELRTCGMTEREAREEAERRFGSVPEYKAALTRIGEARRADVERKELLDTVQQHLSFAWRGVRHRPWFALTVALTMALGIGANSVMFGVIDHLMFREPLHIVDASQVRRLIPRRDIPGIPSYHPALPPSDFELLRQAKTIRGMAVYTYGQFTYGEGVDARKIEAGLVSSGYFKLLGTQPVIGRFFAESDDSASADNAPVVLGYSLWQREFAGRASVLGTTVRVGESRFTVIGVAPDGFTGVELDPTDLWVPFYSGGDALWGGSRRWRTTDQLMSRLVVRLVPGTESAAASELLALKQAGPAPSAPQYRWLGVAFASLIPGRAIDRDDSIRVSLWLAGTSIVLLIIASANVATLLLSRAVQRRRESAVRLALGIGRRRLIGHLVSESVLLAVAGAAGALMITATGSHALRALVDSGLAWPSTVLNPRLIAFTFLVAVGTGVIAGFIPAWLESRPDQLGSLKQGGLGGGARRSRLQGGLIVAQASLSVALLVGAGLFARSLIKVRSIVLGIEPDRSMVIMPEFPQGTDRDTRIRVVENALPILQGNPLVESAALSTAAPLTILGFEPVIKGLDSLPLAPHTELFTAAVTPDYFRTIGTTLLRGRNFDDNDVAGAPPVVVVSQVMAQALYPGRDALGRCVDGRKNATECVRIVGIVADVRWSDVLDSPSFALYAPLGQVSPTAHLSRFLIIRSRGDGPAAVAGLRSAVMSALPGARAMDMVRLQEMVDPAAHSWRLGATLFLVFGALALVVAAVGIYSVMACRVEQRRHEMGVRSALGAEWGDLIRLVVGEGILLVAGGVALGLLFSLAAAPAIAPLLYQTSPRDPSVFAVVSGVLLLAAVIACLVPAVRASRVGPLEALKAE